ncbi:MAG: GntP family permease [Clostridiales bacterium]|nr:GntP family permease [Clostridiales bacterium]
MEFVAIAGMILAVAVLIIGAYRGIGALPITLLAAIVVALTNRIDLWNGIAGTYIDGYISVYKYFLLMFCCSSLYAKLMDLSGSATAIGYQFIDWFGKKNVMLVSTLVISVLTYGGVSLFVVVYAVAPIMFLLFKEADLPRHLTMACLITGSASYTMTAMPGTPSLTNAIPTTYLGTTLTAAPIMGIIATIAMFGLAMVYMKWAEKKARANNEHWTYPDKVDPKLYEVKDRSTLPNIYKAFAPLITLVVIIVAGSQLKMTTTSIVDGVEVTNTVARYTGVQLAVVGMVIAAAMTYLLNLNKFHGKDMKAIVTSGFEGGIDGIGGLAGVSAFGAVVASSDAYKGIVDYIGTMNMNPYLLGVVATMLISAITGSSSGGLRIMFTSLKDTFLSSNANLPVLHRLTAISADALDTLPHSPGLFVMLDVLGLEHKNAYRHVFWCSTLIPLFVTAVLTLISVLFL